LLEQDWEIYTETVARVLLGWAAGEQARQFAEFFRECVTPEVLRGAIGAVYDLDVTSFLPRVRCPTLVLQPRQIANPGVKVAASLATQIKDSRLVLLEGASPLWFTVDVGAVLRAIGDFLGVELEPARAAQDRGQAPVILFTDIRAPGPHAAPRRARGIFALNVIARMRTHGGSEIKHTGDGIMASFASGSRAISAALAMQRGFAAHNDSNPDAAIHVRIGLNAGEPVAEEGDLFGTAVQLAARIAAHADPGQLLVSNVVRELAAGKGFLFSDRGEVALRGFEDPVRLYQVRWQEDE
jgi:class 3 adenylate cyclase